MYVYESLEPYETHEIPNSLEFEAATRKNIITVPRIDYSAKIEPFFTYKNIDYSLLSLINEISDQEEYHFTGENLKKIFYCYKMGLYQNICMMLNSAVNTKIKETYYEDEASMKNRDSENFNIENEILSELNKLTFDMQKKVLDFVRSLTDSSPKGVAGNELLKFAGIFTPEEGKELLEIIEKDCGVIDFSEW